MSEFKTLAEAKYALNTHLQERPTITGWPGFDAKAHIAAVDSWIAEKELLVKIVDSLTDAEEKARIAEYNYRKNLWLSKHYPSQKTGGSNHGE